MSSIEVRNCNKQELFDLVSTKRQSESAPQSILYPFSPRPRSLKLTFTPSVINRQMHWFRSRAPVKADPAFQKCVLAYASDLSFIGTAARAMGLGARTVPALGMLASLDHAMCKFGAVFSSWREALS